MKTKIENFEGWHRTLLEMILGIVLTGILLEIGGLVLVPSRGAYTLGLGIGLVMAVFFVTQMAFSIDRALDWDERGAKAELNKGHAIRYACIILVLVVVGYFKIGNYIACFLGLFTIKAGAYLQPQIHKFINKKLNIEEGGNTDESITDQSDLWPEDDPWDNEEFWKDPSNWKW